MQYRERVASQANDRSGGRRKRGSALSSRVVRRYRQDQWSIRRDGLDVLVGFARIR
jgi:hypothetical protein